MNFASQKKVQESGWVSPGLLSARERISQMTRRRAAPAKKKPLNLHAHSLICIKSGGSTRIPQPQMVKFLASRLRLRQSGEKDLRTWCSTHTNRRTALLRRQSGERVGCRAAGCRPATEAVRAGGAASRPAAPPCAARGLVPCSGAHPPDAQLLKSSTSLTRLQIHSHRPSHFTIHTNVICGQSKIHTFSEWRKFANSDLSSNLIFIFDAYFLCIHPCVHF